MRIVARSYIVHMFQVCAGIYIFLSSVVVIWCVLIGYLRSIARLCYLHSLPHALTLRLVYLHCLGLINEFFAIVYTFRRLSFLLRGDIYFYGVRVSLLLYTIQLMF